jgi:hypothetical protein
MPPAKVIPTVAINVPINSFFIFRLPPVQDPSFSDAATRPLEIDSDLPSRLLPPITSPSEKALFVMCPTHVPVAG